MKPTTNTNTNAHAQLVGYIQQVALALNFKDGVKLGLCLTISPGQNEGIRRANYPEPSEFDLFLLPEVYREVVRAHLGLMRYVYLKKDISKAFDALNDLVGHLIRAANTETNWINTALINACTELITVYKVKQQTNPEEESIEFQDLEMDMPQLSSLEELASTINKAFKLSLNDKNLDLKLSKRVDLYFFLGALIQVYFKLGKLELAKSVEKVIKNTRFQLPELNGILPSKKYAVSYLYYSALLSLDDADFNNSEEKLMKALDVLTYYKENKTKQTEKILLILLPLRLYNKRLTPKEVVWNEYPILRYIYKDSIFEAIRRGNLFNLEASIKKFEVLLLKKHLYLLVERLKELCYLRLIHKTVLYFQSLHPDSKTNHIIDLSAFQIALECSSSDGTMKKGLGDRSFRYPIEEIECVLANFISSSKIKGYISHSNRCIVLSKQNAFPNEFTNSY